MVKKVLVLFVFFMIPVVGFSQVPPAGPPPPPPGLPIDNLIGVLCLIIFGIIYGSKKILKDSSS